MLCEWRCSRQRQARPGYSRPHLESNTRARAFSRLLRPCALSLGFRLNPKPESFAACARVARRVCSRNPGSSLANRCPEHATERARLLPPLPPVIVADFARSFELTPHRWCQAAPVIDGGGLCHRRRRLWTETERVMESALWDLHCRLWIGGSFDGWIFCILRRGVAQRGIRERGMA